LSSRRSKKQQTALLELRSFLIAIGDDCQLVFLTEGQQAEWARNELVSTSRGCEESAKAEGEGKSLVSRAQGEADANRTAEFVAAIGILRRIDSNRALIDKWNGALRTVQSGTGKRNNTATAEAEVTAGH
jgi:hypothetical protein